MNSSVKTVSIFDTLSPTPTSICTSAPTTTGPSWRYYAYVEFCNVRGFEPVPLDQFDRKDYTGYLGTFYSNTESSALANNPDTVEAYIPKANVTLNVTQSDGTVLENWPLIANGDEYGQNMKYLIYCGGDQPTRKSPTTT